MSMYIFDRDLVWENEYEKVIQILPLFGFTILYIDKYTFKKQFQPSESYLFSFLF
jgi:hypothetical protein